MFRIAIAAFAALLLVGCQSVEHNTASGRPEVTVPTSSADTKAAVIGTWVNLGYSLKRDSDYQLVLEAPVSNVMANMLLGSQYDPTVEARTTFTLLPSAGSTRVVGEVALVTNGGSSFEKLTPLNNGQDSAGMQRILNDIAAGFAAGKKTDQVVAETVAASKARKAAAQAKS